MFSTGCRIGEIVSLDRARINWSNRSAIIRGKGDKEREVYFNIRCQIWLKRYLDNREDRDTAIFVTERDPHRMSIAQMRYIIKRISNRASINKDIHPHQLRHSYATHLLNNGAPLDVIQSLLGHEKSETTRIYAQLSGSIILQSIPGIGEKIAATIISEIGEIDRFNDPKKLVAFAGVDPSVYSSGKFTASVNRITKRGSCRLRHALYMAVQSGTRDSRKKKTTDEIIARNKRLREFYDKKREEGKPFRVAVIACVNKLLHWIYALLKSRTTFQDIA